MDAVVLAGGIPRPEDPLYSYSNGEAKALIDVAGKPMVQWVLDALCGSRLIERIVVMGLSTKTELKCKKPITYLSNQGKLLENLKVGTAKVLELNPKAEYVLFASSDIPGITSEMVDWLLKTCGETDDDIYYNVIRREDMEKRYPNSKRTWTPLKDMEVCGGDMNMARTSIVNEHSDFWNKIIEARKSPTALAALLGPVIAFKLLTRQLTIDDVIRRVAEKLGLKGRGIVCPYAEVGMDVDKPHQLGIIRADLTSRMEQEAPKARRTSKTAVTGRKTAAKTAAKTKTASAKKSSSKTATRAKP